MTVQQQQLTSLMEFPTRTSASVMQNCHGWYKEVEPDYRLKIYHWHVDTEYHHVDIGCRTNNYMHAATILLIQYLL